MLSYVQHVATTTATLVASPRILTVAVLALAGKPLFALINICKRHAEGYYMCMEVIKQLKISALVPLF